MAFLTLTASETKDKTQGRAAFNDAIVTSLEAIQQHPMLDEQKHLNLVQDVCKVVEDQTDFVKGRRNFYINKRANVGGDINGPATVLKFIFIGQRSFSLTDAQNLYSHLSTKFANTKINVGANGNKPMCLIHIGL